MKVYIFDDVTHEFLRDEEAFQEPICGEYVRPVNGTFIAPDISTDTPNTALVFDDIANEWHVVPDYRGKSAVSVDSGNITTVDVLGELPDDMVILPDELLEEYRTSPDHFNVTHSGVARKPYDEIDEIEKSAKQQQRRNDRDNMLDAIDWRVQRAYDAMSLGITCPDNMTDLMTYRQYLRDFTTLDDWWDLEIPTYEDFVKEEKEEEEEEHHE